MTYMYIEKCGFVKHSLNSVLIPSSVGLKILGSLSYDNHNSGENVSKQKVNSCCFKIDCSYSMSFNLPNVREF